MFHRGDGRGADAEFPETERHEALRGARVGSQFAAHPGFDTRPVRGVEHHALALVGLARLEPYGECRAAHAPSCARISMPAGTEPMRVWKAALAGLMERFASAAGSAICA